MRSGRVKWASQPMPPMRLWYASLQCLRAGEALSSGDSAMELMGTLDQYGVAIGVCACWPSKKLLTRLEAKPDWLRLTVTDKGVIYAKRSGCPGTSWWYPWSQLCTVERGADKRDLQLTNPLRNEQSCQRRDPGREESLIWYQRDWRGLEWNRNRDIDLLVKE